MSNPSSVPSPGASQGMSTKPTTGGNSAAKVFKEFKWGLLTLFLLMAVVIGLVYDGGKKKTTNTAGVTPTTGGTDTLGSGTTPPADPLAGGAGVSSNPGFTSNTGPGYSADPIGAAPGADPFAAPGNSGMPGGTAGMTGGRPGASTPANDPYSRVGNWNSLHEPYVPSTPPDYPVDGAKETARKVAEKKAGAKTDTKVVEKSSEKSTEKSAGDTYKVVAGDTLSGIASKLFPGKAKTGLKALTEANKNIDPNKMRVGQTLKVPVLAAEKAETTKVAKASIAKETDNEPKPDHLTLGEKEAKAKEASADTYVVASGDTLEKIASKLYHDRSRWQEIFDLNKDKLSSPGSIRIGQKLKIKSGEATEAKAEPKTEKTGKKHTTVAQADLSGVEGVTVIGGSSDAPKSDVKPAKHKEEVSSAATVWMP